MNSNKFLNEVYTVRENSHDNQEDYSGNDYDRDSRRGRQDFYDTISDPSSLGNAIDPISDQDQFRNSSVLMQTPAAPLFPDRGISSTPGTVPYDAQAQKLDQATSVKSRPMQTSTPATMVENLWQFALPFCQKYLQSAWKKLSSKILNSYYIFPGCLTICIYRKTLKMLLSTENGLR